MTKKILKITGVIIGALLAILIAIVCALSTETVQQMLYAKGIEMLSEKLQTRIKVDSISISYTKGGVALYGFEMDDHQHVTMLKVDTLVASMQLWPLLDKEVDIDAFYLHGVKAVLYRERPDSAANYQFVLDAFTPKRKAKRKDGEVQLNAHLKIFDVSRADFTWDNKAFPRKGEGKFDSHHLAMRDFSVKVRGDILKEKGARVDIRNLSGHEENSKSVVNIKEITALTFDYRHSESEICDLHFTMPGKKLSVDSLYVVKKGKPTDLKQNIDIQLRGLNYWTNNGKPRKNKIKPHRGAFDPGHLDACVNADITIHEVGKKSLSLTVKKMDMLDRGSGLDVRSLTADVNWSGDDIFVRNTKVSLGRHTTLNMGTAHLRLTHKPSAFTLYPVKIKSDVVLKDISKPFAPVLSNFTTPLKLRVTCQGNLDRILFKDILVTGLHKAVIVTAQGDLCDVAKKKLLHLHFWDIEMASRGKATKTLVGHFAKKVNLKMQRQMHKLGDVRYKGKLGVFYKRVGVSGTLFSNYGDVSFDFTLNGFTKYMTGTMQTTGFEIGKLMNVKHLGPVSATASYSFSTAKKKVPGKHKKGKLPKGTLSAAVEGARYGIISMKHITADFESDGRTAKGTIIAHKKLLCIIVDVSYHQTAEDQSMHYKVHLQKHKKHE